MVKLERKYPDRKIFIFDLDETLFHCTAHDKNPKSDIVIDVKANNGKLVKAGFNLRKYYRECVEEAGKLFEVIAFTASV